MKRLAWWAVVTLDLFSSTVTHAVPSSLKWKSKNICCIYAKTNPVVFCFCSTRGRWDVFDVEETHHMLPLLRDNPAIILMCEAVWLCSFHTGPEVPEWDKNCIPNRWMQTNLPLTVDQFLHRLTPLPWPGGRWFKFKRSWENSKTSALVRWIMSR